jgi:hypothetical protein
MFCDPKNNGPQEFSLLGRKVLHTIVIFDDVNLSNFVTKSVYTKVEMEIEEGGM